MYSIDKTLVSHVQDKMLECEEKSIITFTTFLTPEEQSYLLNFLNKNKSDTKAFLYGGYDDSERRMILFLPYYAAVKSQEELYEYLKENKDDNPLSLLHFDKDNFSTVSHRDYLGALMGLGIKREMIGDILVKTDGADIYVLNKISDYILENLKSAGHATLHGKCLPIDSKSEQINNFESKLITISSLRLDNIISGCYNLSRGNAVLAIESGLIFVNAVLITKPDFKMHENDKIVYRGKGKSILSEVIEKSKKDKIRIMINYYK